MIESVVLQSEWDVNRRLVELRLGPRYRLLEVVRVALSSGANATRFHAANAAGTYTYHEGIWALRDEFVDDVAWRIDRPNGVEVIANDELKVRVTFANVDIACDEQRKPKPRSHKGAGSEQVCIGNLFGNLPEFAPRQAGGWVTFYLMVDIKGAAELTCPVIKNSTFVAWPERLYLSDGSDLDQDPKIMDDEIVMDDFDPQVIRK